MKHYNKIILIKLLHVFVRILATTVIVFGILILFDLIEPMLMVTASTEILSKIVTGIVYLAVGFVTLIISLYLTRPLVIYIPSSEQKEMRIIAKEKGIYVHNISQNNPK